MSGEHSPRDAPDHDAVDDKVIQADPADEEPGADSEALGDEEIARLDDQLRRTAADLDNLRKRYQRDLARERLAERSRAAAAWLPVVDNLELALQHTDDDSDPFVQGVRAVYDQAVAALAQLGFPAFDPTGQPFDPAMHEAVSTLIDEQAPEGTIVAVVRPGYGSSDALLRPAAVVVAKR
ncbi:MAG TPA: nucleotide exchange factor GrpE [Kribbella sp.]|nr:nucleotide exchange factor GrpE [Kribbella sp.]